MLHWRGNSSRAETGFVIPSAVPKRACVYAMLCDPGGCSPPGSSVHGLLQARVLEWLAMPPPGDLPNPGINPVSLTSACSGRQALYHKSLLGSPRRHRYSKSAGQMDGYGVFLRLSLCLYGFHLLACLLACLLEGFCGFVLGFLVFFFFCLLGSQFPNQRLNPGHSSEY